MVVRFFRKNATQEILHVLNVCILLINFYVLTDLLKLLICSFPVELACSSPISSAIVQHCQCKFLPTTMDFAGFLYIVFELTIS